MKKNIQVLIVDDTRLVNEGINSLLSDKDGIEVIGNVLSGLECIDFIQKHSVDVVLLDHQMPEMSGLETLQKINELGSNVKVVLLTLFNEQNLLKAYMDVGIQGCMLKQDSPSELAFGIQMVAQGEPYFSSSVAKVLAGRASRTVKPSNAGRPVDVDRLTKAEWQILALIGEGMSVEEISKIRHTSAKTVSRQKQSIMDKLNIHKETKLMRYAINHGIE